MRYRKKPVVIEARQWDGTIDSAARLISWMLENDLSGASWYAADPGVLHIPTLEGVMAASPGDYIIQGVSGEFYPCKPDIFDATYDPVED